MYFHLTTTILFKIDLLISMVIHFRGSKTQSSQLSRIHATTVSIVQHALYRVTCMLLKVLSARSILVSRRRDIEVDRDIDLAVVSDFSGHDLRVGLAIASLWKHGMTVN